MAAAQTAAEAAEARADSAGAGTAGMVAELAQAAEALEEWEGECRKQRDQIRALEDYVDELHSALAAAKAAPAAVTPGAGVALDAGAFSPPPAGATSTPQAGGSLADELAGLELTPAAEPVTPPPAADDSGCGVSPEPAWEWHRMVAVHDFLAMDAQQLSFREGEELSIMAAHRERRRWWLAVNGTGKQGVWGRPPRAAAIAPLKLVAPQATCPPRSSGSRRTAPSPPPPLRGAGPCSAPSLLRCDRPREP